MRDQPPPQFEDALRARGRAGFDDE